MEQIVEVARLLRRGAPLRRLHPPEGDPGRVGGPRSREAGLLADRLSVNIELPTDADLVTLAPDKDARGIETGMRAIRARHEDSASRARSGSARRRASRPQGRRRRWSSARARRPTASSSRARPSCTAGTRCAASTTPPTARRRASIRALPLAARAAPARAPALPGRLAHALLRLQRGRDPRAPARTSRSTSIRSSRGRCGTARCSRRREHGARRSAAARPGSACAAWSESSRRGGSASSALAELRRLRIPMTRAAPFLVCAGHNPGLRALDREDLAARFKPPPRQLGPLRRPVRGRRGRRRARESSDGAREGGHQGGGP